MVKCSNAFFSETTNMIKAKLYMNVHWMVLYKLQVFCSDMKRYFFFTTIELSVPRFTTSDYLFGTFSLIPLYFLSLDLRFLITSLVLFFNSIVLSVPRFTASDYLFGTFSLIPLYFLSLYWRLLITSLVLFLSYHSIVCPSIDGFWLPLWYFFFNTIVLSVPWFTASDYLFDPFSLISLYCLSLDLRLLISSLVLFL